MDASRGFGSSETVIRRVGHRVLMLLKNQGNRPRIVGCMSKASAIFLREAEFSFVVFEVVCKTIVGEIF